MRTILIFLFLNLLFITAYSQKLYAFLLCKTSDSSIGSSVKLNYINMKEQLVTIATALNYEYVEHSLTGPQFNLKNVNKVLNNADIKKDDIVFLYFSTHGAKSIKDATIFPQLDIPNELVPAHLEHEVLRTKGSKILITAIEACSGYQDITPQQAFVTEQSFKTKNVDELNLSQIENIKSLFSSGCEIIITAGNPGKDTWATSQGSMFTNCFLRAMTESFNLPSSRNCNWDNLLNQAKRYTYEMTSNTTSQYYPVWEKYDCNGLVSQKVIDSSAVERRDFEFKILTQKTRRRRNPYDVELKIINNSGIKIDSVTYFLHKTFVPPIVTLTNDNNDFRHLLAAWGKFPIKAKVYFSDHKIFEAYKDFNFPNQIENR